MPNPTPEEMAAITVPLDLFKRLVALASDAFPSEQVVADIKSALDEIEQVEALLASPLE